MVQINGTQIGWFKIVGLNAGIIYLDIEFRVMRDYISDDST